jgi:hypothetical protein
MILTALPFRVRTPLQLVYSLEAIRAGFPSSARDDADSSVDLNEALISDKTSPSIE